MTFVSSTEDFLTQAAWLTDADAPAVAGMRAAALALDEVLNPPVLAQYRLFYTGLLKRAPQTDEAAGDPLEEALRAAG